MPAILQNLKTSDADRPKLQALVYDILPLTLKEGAGKRWSECGRKAVIGVCDRPWPAANTDALDAGCLEYAVTTFDHHVSWSTHNGSVFLISHWHILRDKLCLNNGVFLPPRSWEVDSIPKGLGLCALVWLCIENGVSKVIIRLILNILYVKKKRNLLSIERWNII